MSLRSVSPLSPIMTDDEILAKAEAIKKQRKIAEKQRIAEANGRVRPVNLD